MPLDIGFRRAVEQVIRRMVGWQSWTPTLSANNSMTYTSTTVNYARFYRLGNVIHFAISVTGTVGGTPSTGLKFSLPVASADDNAYARCYVKIDDGGTYSIGECDIYQTLAYVFKADYANWGAGAGRVFWAEGFYEAA